MDSRSLTRVSRFADACVILGAVYETVLLETRDGVAWLTLNRPEVHNAFDSRMLRELSGIWRALREDDDVRVVVVTGAGDRAFCTGIDRSEAMAGDDAGRKAVGSRSTPFHFDDPGSSLGPKSNDLWKPVVAAVNGMACAGAFYLLGEVDIVIAADTATFFDPHVTYGMAASFESMHILQRLPLGETLRMQLLGAHERMSAQRAYQVGLVSEVVPLAELPQAAEWVASRIAAQPTLAVQATVRATWAAQDLGRQQALALGYAYVGLGTSRDSIAQGQEFFTSGQRVDWRLR
jgi:enoyl-CoA hydratase/carnithine racemase